MDGIIIVDKPKGYTSHDVVNVVKKTLNTSKVGHTGTLDPNATGVLPVLVGKATKISKYLIEHDKTYIAELALGEKSSTGDIEGEIIERKEVPNVTEEQIKEVLQKFLGKQMQTPPIYSSIKINGKKAYEYARSGQTIEIPAREIEIMEISLSNFEDNIITFKVSCSKGTYIRTLCHDIGQKLGCGACMEKLTRTKVSRFEIKDSLTLAQIEVLKKEDRLSEILIPIDQMFANYPSIIVSGEAARLAYNGNGIKDRDVRKDENILDEAYVRVYDDVEDFIGVYQYHEKEREYRIRKMFYIKEEK